MAGHIKVRWVPCLTLVLFSLSAVGLAGCAGYDEPYEVPTVEVSSAATMSSPRGAQREEIASELIKGYRQMVVDLYSGRVTDVAELKRYASGDRLAEDKRTIPDALAAGRRASVGNIDVLWVDEAGTSARADQMIILACVDAGDVSFTDEAGTAQAGRDLLEYQLNQAAGAWTIVSVVAPDETPARKC